MRKNLDFSKRHRGDEINIANSKNIIKSSSYSSGFDFSSGGQERTSHWNASSGENGPETPSHGYVVWRIWKLQRINCSLNQMGKSPEYCQLQRISNQLFLDYQLFFESPHFWRISLKIPRIPWMSIDISFSHRTQKHWALAPCPGVELRDLTWKFQAGNHHTALLEGFSQI